MPDNRIFNLLIVTSLLFVLLCACSSKNVQSKGVAKINTSPVIETAPKDENVDSKNTSLSSSTPKSDTEELQETDLELTDEEITTKFAECMRDKGFNVSDPEVNADGTVNLQALRSSITNDPKFNPQSPDTQRAFQECLPQLQGATFAQTPSQEDQIEFQDNMLKFTECIRGEGLDIPDPDFSKGIRQAMGSIFQGLNMQSPKGQKAISACRETIFAGTAGGRGGR